MFPVLVKLNISISYAQWNSRGIQKSHIIRDLGVMSIMTSAIDCSVEQHLSPKSFCDTRHVCVFWGVKKIYIGYQCLDVIGLPNAILISRDEGLRFYQQTWLCSA